MPTYSQAAKEALVTAGDRAVLIETLELSHSALAESIYIASSLEDIDATLEDDTDVTFEGVAFKLTLPATGDSGLQDLSITIDNTDDRIRDFVRTVKGSKEPVLVKYRPYLSTDLTQPQTAVPLILYLRSMALNLFEASGRASFADLVNKKFPRENYVVSRFPSLGQ